MDYFVRCGFRCISQANYMPFDCNAKAMTMKFQNELGNNLLEGRWKRR